MMKDGTVRTTGRRRGLGRALCVSVAAGVAVPFMAWATGGSAGIDLLSAHVWRGDIRNDEVVVQPSAVVELPAGFAADVRATYDTDAYTGSARANDFSEIDFGAWYERRLGEFDLALGATAYAYSRPDDLEDTTEAFARAAWQRAGWRLAAACYRDVDARDSTYGDMTLQYALPLCPGADMIFGGRLGLANDAFSAGPKGGWHDGEAWVGLSSRLMEALELGATVGYTDSLDQDVLPDQDVGWQGGLHAVWHF